MLNAIAFAVLSLLVILGAVMMMTTRNILHAAYWLLEVAIVTAAILWFLGAEYIAVVQLLVYAGAVGVLVVFTLMVTYRTRHELERPMDGSVFALLTSIALLALITYAIMFSPSLTR
ncbi:MAG: NADH-quinone oxidoreductase subunit J, partial [Coriobacteriia bacterium]|nr:NADH-quinone oxidoreductase subunit J [Coriobacteriia bacterium]